MEFCRLCYLRTPLRLSKNIFAMQQDLPVLNIITRLSDLDLNENDSYSKFICSVCYQKIINIYKFQQVILGTDLKFRHQFNNDSSINNNCQKSNIKTEMNCQSITNDCGRTENNQPIVTVDDNNKINQHENVEHIDDQINMVKHSPVFEVDSNNKLNGNQKIDPTVYNNLPTNTNDDVFVCNTCGKRFSYKHNFKDHLNIHTGEKPYKCNICNRTFSANSNLKTHQTVHTKEKAFECNNCGKLYKHNANLKAHLKLHQNRNESLIDKKRFKCGICGKEFAYQRNLKVHVNLHTDEEV